MKISIFSQSLFALPLEEAIPAAGDIGFEAFELACTRPHFTLEMACDEPSIYSDLIEKCGMKCSALSLFTQLTDPATVKDNIESSKTFIRLAPVFDTKIIKVTPGGPGSADATEENWKTCVEATKELVEVAEEVGVKLAYETHMRQLTDTLASSMRFLELVDSKTVGLTVDYSNMAFAGDDVVQCAKEFYKYTFNTHIKNGYIDDDGGWHFQELDKGLTDYRAVLKVLADNNYDGYLTIECLGPDAKEKPKETAARDFNLLKGLVAEIS